MDKENGKAAASNSDRQEGLIKKIWPFIPFVGPMLRFKNDVSVDRVLTKKETTVLLIIAIILAGSIILYGLFELLGN